MIESYSYAAIIASHDIKSAFRKLDFSAGAAQTHAGIKCEHTNKKGSCRLQLAVNVNPVTGRKCLQFFLLQPIAWTKFNFLHIILLINETYYYGEVVTALTTTIKNFIFIFNLICPSQWHCGRAVVPSGVLSYYFFVFRFFLHYLLDWFHGKLYAFI